MISKYAKVEGGIVTNIIMSDDSYASMLDGVNIKVTEETRNAEIGFSYDDLKGYFISNSPWPSWILDEDDNWVSPQGPKPEGKYVWNEAELSWMEVVSE